MKKKTLVAIMVALSMGILAGCGEDTETNSPFLIESSPTSTESEPTQTEPVESTEPSSEAVVIAPITERTVENGMMQSYLTGEWKPVEVVTRRNFAIMIPNNKPALPQYGISQASIIYEAPVEGRITRLMAFFEDYDDLDRVGPVRSSRDYFLYESMAYDSIYCNWGLAVPFVAPVINTDRVDNISQAVSGIDVPAPNAFDRVSRSGYATEFTGYMFIDGYEKEVNRLGYETEYTDRFEQAFTFADDCIMEYEEYPEATQIFPGGNGVSNKGGYAPADPCFAYNAEDHLYYRTQYGAAQVDEYNGEQVAVTNVVYKICTGEVREPSDKDYLAFGVHGTGEAYVFTNGRVIHGTWQRTGDYAPNLFLDDNGNEIIFNQGKTWICCIWDQYKEYSTYK